MLYNKATAAIFVLVLASASATSSEVGEARDGTITLSGSNGNTFWYNAIYVIPILIAIILLDFAIFGTFATRSDELNPVSKFFYHAREGLEVVRHRNRLQRFGGPQGSYAGGPRPPTQGRPPVPQDLAARPAPHRVARWIQKKRKEERAVLYY